MREDDLSKEDQLAILDETKQTLSQRVARLNLTGLAWAKDPCHTLHTPDHQYRSGARRHGEIFARSTRTSSSAAGQRPTSFYVGAQRRDVLRRVAGSWKIAGRKIILDQNVLLAKNVSIFFVSLVPQMDVGRRLKQWTLGSFKTPAGEADGTGGTGWR